MGFGLSVNGGMTGADFFIVESKNLSFITDFYTLDVRYPQEDECNNWELTDVKIESGFFLVQVRRKLDTGDSQDLPIIDDGDVAIPVSRVIAAWGDDDSFAYHGNNRARGALRWFSSGELEQERFNERMATESANKFVLAAKNYSIKEIPTEYAYICFGFQDLMALGVPMDDGVTLVGFNPVIDKAKHLHHFILYAKTNDFDKNETCNIGNFFGEVSYVWAPGEPPFALPDNVGFALGGNDSGAYRSYMLEIHYDNSDLIDGQVDSSGVELFYIESPREYMAGFFIVGDPYVALSGSAIERGLSDWYFQCPSSCSTLGLNGNVTVLREYLHMHKAGYSTYNEHIREGKVIRTGRVDYFDFDQSGNPAVQQETSEVIPGDSFNMRCYYKNDIQNRTFGFGSSDEMCMGFLLYYPRQVILVESLGELPWICGVGFSQAGFGECEVEVAMEVLAGNETLDRTFGKPARDCVVTGGSDGNQDVGDSESGMVAWDVSMPNLMALVTLSAFYMF